MDKTDRWKPQPQARPEVASLERQAPPGPAGRPEPADETGGDHDAESPHRQEEYRDALPADLDASGFVGPYLFPDNRRRRIAAAIYAVGGAALLALWGTHASGGVLVNRGTAIGGVVLLLLAVYHVIAGYRLIVRDLAALTAASREVGFPVGHASAQLAWRGLRSRPTWRILLYSAENPPDKRGLVLVDGVDGEVVAHFVERNPEDWSDYRT